MPLSPADFYAYSQATGAPVADTPEKRAQQAPAVLAFRQQQLQAPKQDSNLIDTLGKVALGAGLAAGAGYGISRLLRNRGVAEGVRQATVHDVTAAAEQNVRRAAAYQEPGPSRVATTASPTGAATTASPTPGTQRPNLGIQVVDLSNVRSTMPDPWHSASTASISVNEPTQVQNPQAVRALPPARPSSYDYLKQYNLSTGRIAAPKTGQFAAETVQPSTGRDRAQELIDEYIQNTALETRRQDKIQRELAAQKEGAAMRILNQLRQEARQQPPSNVESTQSIFKRLNAHGLSLTGAENDQGQIEVFLSRLDSPRAEEYYVTPHPLAQHSDPKYQQYALQNQQKALDLLAKAGIQPQEAVQHIHSLFNQASPETLVDKQHALLGHTVDQSMNAVAAAEDQVTGRMKHMLQQNPHLDMGQVELMEEIAEHNYQQGMEQNEPMPMEHVTAELYGHEQVPQQDELTGPQAAAQHFAQQRLALAEQGIHGLRAEKLLAKPYLPGAPYVAGPEGYQERQQRKGLTLALQTGDPNILKVFETGTLPSTVSVPWGGTQLGKVATSEFMHPTTLEEAVEGAATRHAENVEKLKTKLADITNEIQPQINQLENQQYQEYIHAQERIPQIDQELNMVEHAISRGRSRGSGEFFAYRGALTAERNRLSQHTGDHLQDQIDHLNNRLNRANEVYGDLIEQQQVNVPQTLKSWSSEALKVSPTQGPTQKAGYIDPITGEFHVVKQVETGPSVPITSREGLTLGSVSMPRDIKSKGGGGRNVGEYVAGSRPPEIVRTLKGNIRMRDYDPETGAVAEHYQPDLTQTERIRVGTRIETDPSSVHYGKRVPEYEDLTALNRALDIYGIRRATDQPDDPTMRPTTFTGEVTTSGRVRTGNKAAAQQSVLAAEAARQGRLQVPPQQGPRESLIDPEKYFVIPSLFVKREAAPASTRQLSFPSDVIPTVGRTRVTAADVAAQQLESYMSKLQRGRSTPLTSEVVIQPRLF